MTAPMPGSGRASPPRGWLELVKREPGLFPLRPGALPPVAAVVLDPKLQQRLAEVFFDIGRSFRWQSDPVTFGKSDHWALPEMHGGLLRGDCEDYCLAVRAELLRLGWPREALRLCLCLIPKAEARGGARGHLVLTAGLLRDTLVLDCQRTRVLSWADYGWNTAEAPAGDAGQWLTREMPGRLEWEWVKED